MLGYARSPASASPCGADRIANQDRTTCTESSQPQPSLRQSSCRACLPGQSTQVPPFGDAAAHGGRRRQPTHADFTAGRRVARIAAPAWHNPPPREDDRGGPAVPGDRCTIATARQIPLARSGEISSAPFGQSLVMHNHKSGNDRLGTTPYPRSERAQARGWRVGRRRHKPHARVRAKSRHRRPERLNHARPLPCVPRRRGDEPATDSKNFGSSLFGVG